MELRHLRYFVAVAEESSFTRAAERLQMAQPPLSSQIANLEKELGVRLFSRSHKRISLTSAGRIFLTESRKTIAQAERAALLAKSAERGELGSIHIGYSRQTGTYLLPRLLTLLNSRFPEVEISISPGAMHSIITDIEIGKLDFGLVRLPVPSQMLETKIVLEDRLVVIVGSGHPFSVRESIPLEYLRNETFVVIERKIAGEYAGVSLLACREAGFAPKTVEYTDSLLGQFAKVAAGRGVALVPASAKTFVSAWSGIRAVGLSDLSFRVDLALAWRKGNLSSIGKLIVDEVGRLAFA